MTQTFGDYNLAARTKEAISTLVRKEVEALRPIPRYATVTSLDPLMVTYSGDTTPMPVKTGSVIPTAVGQIVRIDGPKGDRFVTDVVGGIDENVPPYEGGGGNKFPDGIIIGDEDDPDGSTIILPTPPGSVLGLSVTQGLEFENIYIIVDWDLTPNATDYDVELAEKLGANTYDLVDIKRTPTNRVRFNNLQPYTEYGIRLRAMSNLGLLGPPTLWHDFETTGDNTIPPQVHGLELSRGATSMVVNFTPLTELQAPDVANGKGLYEVQIDTANTFNTSNLRSSLGSASIVAFADLGFLTTWYARVRAIDTSGNLGTWSNVASLEAGQIVSGEIADSAITGSKIGVGAITRTKITDDAITTPKLNAGAVIADKIAAGQINSDKIVTAGLDAAVVKFGTMHGDRIQASTMSVDRLSTAVLTATTSITLVTGGALRIGNPTTNGLLINNQGITGYNNGNITFRVSNTGVATFSGTLSAGISIISPNISGGTISGTSVTASKFTTSNTGARVEIGMGSGRALGYIEFFDNYYGNIVQAGRITGFPGGVNIQVQGQQLMVSGIGLPGNGSPAGVYADSFNGYLVSARNVDVGGVGLSDRLRIGETGTNLRRMRHGRWSGTTNSSGIAIINHGLGLSTGVVPTAVIAVSTGPHSGSSFIRSTSVDLINYNTFRVRCWMNDTTSYTGQATIDWIAIY